MAYVSRITYPTYDLNATEFMEVVRELLQVELLNQKNVHGKSFLPSDIKSDEYLLNNIADKEMNPSYCAIAKAKMENSDHDFPSQRNDMNTYIISILARGLTDLRKIADSIYIILNDLDVKTYLALLENSDGDKYVYRKSTILVSSLSTEIEEKKTANDKNVIYGNLILQAQIVEKTKLNTSTPINSIEVINELGDDKKEVKQLTEY